MSARTLRDWARSRLEVERSRRLDAVEGAASHQWADANARVKTLEAVLRELDAPDEEEP